MVIGIDFRRTLALSPMALDQIVGSDAAAEGISRFIVIMHLSYKVSCK
jgi:hypothetical protein